MSLTLSATYTEIFLRLSVALAIGLVMGMERGWNARDMGEGGRVAGFRTFGLIAFLGGLTALLSEAFGTGFVAAMVIALGAVAGLAHWQRFRHREDFGITTYVAELIAFALGVLAGFGQILVAAAGGAVTTLILSIKPEMHELLQKIERRELLATMRLLIISVVLLPVLPDRGYGPFEALNPYQLWWMVVIIAVISYVGYFAIRIVGERRGVLFTGLFGGFASSTATTINLARLGRRRAEGRSLLVAGIVVSSAMMFPRILVVVGIFAPVLVIPLAWAMVPAGAAGLLIGAVLGLRQRRRRVDQAETVLPRNPLDLKVALQFGLLLAVIMFLARALKAAVGEAGLFALAAVSGLSDVDAITLSFATMIDEGSVTMGTAIGAILVAALVNTAVKPALVAGIAGVGMARRAALALLPPFIAAGAGYWAYTRWGLG